MKNQPPDEFLRYSIEVKYGGIENIPHPDLWWTQAEMREAFMLDCGADPFDAYADRVLRENEERDGSNE